MPEEIKGNTQEPEKKNPASEQPKAEAPGEKTVAKAAEAGVPKPANEAAPAAAKPATPAAAKPVAAAPKPAPAKPAAPAPTPWNSEIAKKFKTRYGSGVQEASTYRDQNYLVVDRTIVYEVLEALRDEEQFDYCVDITAVHYPKREKQFEIVYVLYSFPRNERVRVKTQIADGEAEPSAVPIWETANWLERECYDMFGIQFEGHPDLRRILLPDGWTGYPLRKDYDILKQDTEWVKENLGIESGQ